ncbi:Non-structural maintenance of chromosomes element 4 homolog A [Linum perenne]
MILLPPKKFENPQITKSPSRSRRPPDLKFQSPTNSFKTPHSTLLNLPSLQLTAKNLSSPLDSSSLRPSFSGSTMRTLKRERSTSSAAAPRAAAGGEERVLRSIKLERVRANSRAAEEEAQEFGQGVEERRILRSKYRALQTRINEERDELTNVDSDKFGSFMKEVDDLHKYVQKPREQVADAEALLGLTTSLVSSVKSQSSDGVTVGGFIARLRNAFGETTTGLDDQENAPISIDWKELGHFVSPIFMKFSGFSTMLGPMDTEIKQRKAVTHRARTRLGQSTRPEEVNNAGAEERTDTDKNMATMFGVLRSKKRARLESLILNRRSFAQTVENLFALSFLVKDGRVEIVVDENNNHFVLPRNAPAADSVASKEVAYRHFVFRFDFSDWKTLDFQSMINGVPDGEELMPNRDSEPAAEMRSGTAGTQGTQPQTPIRKRSRNRGLVIQNETVEETPEEEDEDDADVPGRTGLNRCKRRLV